MELLSGGLQTVWCPVAVDDTLYVGQLVRQINEGVAPMAQASGLADQASKMVAVGLIHDGTSANNVPYGIIIGTNKKVPTFSTTYKAESIAYVAPSSAGSDDYFGVEGPWACGDLQAMVKVAVIGPDTVLRARIYNAALGTAPTVGTIASGAGTLGATVNTLEATGVASCSTVYIRSGAAAGSYRVTDDASATVLTWDLALTKTCAVADTLVRIVGLRPNGMSKCQFDAEALWIDCNEELTSHHYMINVVRLDLAVAGREFVDFTLNPYHFLAMDDIA